ncbi:MAG: DUF4178 domain-containing protein [Cytophagales bacterium]|nr:DUF4178 domain-containing protein [Bernardetiaceae bacterium]MDW8203687.1 DUF4178 domain-containing protein [Cytophagales bacterium]
MDNIVSNSLVPYHIQQYLPFAVNAQVAALPEDLQQEFLKLYNRRAKNILVPYFLHFFFPAHYLYLDKFFLQVIFWLTFGGLGFWWVIDIFRIPSLVKARNAEIADEILRHILAIHGNQQVQKQTHPLNKSATHLQPRPLNIAFDPTHITIENLGVGYLLDYQLKTWQVVNQIQYDWTDGTSEREYKLVSGNEMLYLSVRREGVVLDCRIGTIVNLYTIDSQLDKVIQQEGQPPSILYYEGFTLYREHKLSGLLFSHSHHNKPIKVTVWDYLDATRTYHLRIGKDEYQRFFTIFSKKVDEIDFSEILPSGER